MISRRTVAAIVLLLGPAAAQAGKVDYTQTAATPAISCPALQEQQSAAVKIASARVVAAAGALPEHCRVSGTIDPRIGFELNLPARWNGRFYMIGNGGMAGESPDDPMRAMQRDRALARGFAVASTDTGHDARKQPLASFALNDRESLINYAYRAVHLTAVTSKGLAARYYGRTAARSYWESCSTGGRQGLMEAQRFPEDFDGIVAGAPVSDFVGTTIGGIATGQALREAGLTPAKLELVATAVYAKCDAIDGLRDGLIDDPRRCAFDPAKDVTACAAGADDASCLTSVQAAAFTRVYGDVVREGKRLAFGVPVGAEKAATLRMPGAPPANAPPGPIRMSGWTGTLVGPTGGPGFDFIIAESTLKSMVFGDPAYDSRTFDVNRDGPRLEPLREILDATNPDLSALRQRGGKVLLYHGWADTVLMPGMTIDYYTRAQHANAPHSEDFIRLYMIPGMFHCAGGYGPDEFDALSAVVDWVEAGAAPGALIATQREEGKVTRTRPLCPYPRVARQAGKGSENDAASFRCVMPP